jgi:predicted dehydrogenase
MSRLQTAVAGLGFMGGTHIEALRRAGIHVRGCTGANAEETQSGVETYGLEQGYASFDALIADPTVDVVHICTPNYLHYDMCRAAITAGKHVICEKPLAVTSEQSAELVKLAAEKGVVGAVNHNIRFYPLNHDARARIQAGEIGDVRLIHGHYLQDWLFYPTDWNWRLEPDLGGAMRAVADIGTHWFDLITWLTGLKITSVMADMATLIPVRKKPQGEVETYANMLQTEANAVDTPIHTEDYATIMLRFDNGARGVLTVSQVSAGHKNRLQWEINGDAASLGWQQEDPNTLWLGRRDGPNGIIAKDPSLMQDAGRQIAGYPGGHAEGYPDTFKQLFRAVYGYINAGDFTVPPPFPTFTDGHHELVLCDAVLQSSKENRWVDVPQD